jgi:hypothetical protein
MIDKGYNGNSNLKRKGADIEWSQDLILELYKCKKDPIYFAQKYIKITHVDHGLIPIDLYDYQREIIQKIGKNRRVIVGTSRQAGKTTTAAIIILHFVLFNDFKTVALLANKGDAAREILDRIKIAYEALPKWLQQGVVEWNKGSVTFENGCKIIAAATSSSNIRGKSVAFLYIDEAAFVENWDEFFASVFPTISSGETTRILFTSTPNGLNHFYKTFINAKEGLNGYAWVEVPWWRVPGRDENWKNEIMAGLNFDTEKFEQEFNCEFMGSSGTLISGGSLKRLKHIEPIIKERIGINKYENVKKNHTYICTVDVSRGKGLDHSAFHIIDVTEMPYKQVLTFRSNLVAPIEYAEIIFNTCKYYNTANVLVEINDIGGQVADLLADDYEYEAILHTENAGRLGKKISYGAAAERGIRTTKSVKSVGCSLLKLLIEQNQLILNDFETIKELTTFSRKNNSYEAEAGCHDDLVMGLVLFAWLSDQKYFAELTDIHTLKKLREQSEEELMDTLLPFGFMVDHVDEVIHEEKYRDYYSITEMKESF